uniref:Uncharacterized protein n=1 Tax=Anguilla anguilla TaxID=7936 RepID=A0A0E9XJB7_ANGAN
MRDYLFYMAEKFMIFMTRGYKNFCI